MSRGLIILTLVSFVVGAIAFVPARFLDAPINAALAKSNSGEYHATGGTIWSGEGVVRVNTVGRAALTVPVSWQFDPLALLRLRLGVRVRSHAPQLTAAMRMAAGFSDVSIRDVHINTSIETVLLLGGNASILSVAQPSGALNISSASEGNALTVRYAQPFLVNGALVLGSDAITLRSLVSQPLTALQVQLNFKDSQGEFTVLSSTGVLKLDGGGRVGLVPRVANARRDFVYAGFITSAAPLPPAVASALAMAGRATADGRIRVDFQTSF